MHAADQPVVVERDGRQVTLSITPIANTVPQLDADGQVADRYDVKGVPTIVFIDREGRIVCHACRSIDTVLKDVFPG